MNEISAITVSARCQCQSLIDFSPGLIWKTQLLSEEFDMNPEYMKLLADTASGTFRSRTAISLCGAGQD